MRIFHFPVGESTVTLQDMAILFGLPVDGHTVTGKDLGNKLDDLIALCVELLGAAPTQEDFIGSSLKLKWISEHFRHLPHDASDETVHHYARTYIMWLIGGVLVPDKSQNIVKMMFLPLLRDFDRIQEYSWGGATLACLYRMLCRATKADTKEIAGPLVLLQVWAWERLSRIAPSRKSNIAAGERAIGEGDQLLPHGLRACRWRVPFSHEFIWEPYGMEDDIMTSFPSYCTVGRDIWMAQVPLICFDIID
ncbi:serine/threonine-protein phosphatase 7 long form homolog [Camellia sinensis]|uniref:serine/threonine-protein phosphatase 7 long form homolog n=1 Tax=Camellia sinensis TaxID=4442 RepID=UPI001035E762|nr:serine/threonine-protein phosphatase 7 long form homolog [Camellia sinensis]